MKIVLLWVVVSYNILKGECIILVTEVWKEIEGYSGYFVSNIGNVKGLYGRNLKPMLNKVTGYLQVNLRSNNVAKTYRIHYLVANAFLSKVEGKSQINHKDGNKLNNELSNLERVTARENRLHAYSLGLFDKKKVSERGKKGGAGAKNNLGKRVVLVNAEGKEFLFDSVREASAELGLDRRTLQRVLANMKNYNTIKGFKAFYRNRG
jgi:hypothetical protein